MTMVFDENIPATKLLIDVILNRDIEVITTKAQWDIQSSTPEGHNIRLDIYAKEADGETFDCEIQRSSKDANPRRARFYSSMMDTRMLKSAEPYDKLRDSYVIFITEEDYFDKGQPLYSYERRRDNGEDLGDGSHIIYVNGAYRGNDPLGRLMQDLNNQGTEGFNYKVIEDGIKHFKENEKGRVAMRDLIEEYAEERAEEMELEIITKLLRKGKDAEEVADLLDLDIERVKSVEEGMLVNS